MNKHNTPQSATSSAGERCAIQSETLALEERIMFDGAAAAEVADAAVDLSVASDPSAGQGTDATEELVSAAGNIPQTARNEIYFVDASVPDADVLFGQIPQSAEVVLLNADTDGVAQMASVLEGRSDVSAIHILAHGQEGQLMLGGTVLTAETISGVHAQALAGIGAAMSADGDILIYGCDFAGGDTGLVAASLLASATGADVAASEDVTGHAQYGGDWELEAEIGVVEAQSLSAQAWVGVLAPPEITLPEAALATPEDTDLVISDLSVDDTDGDPLAVTLNVTSGTIQLFQTTNLTVTGDGTNAVSLSGSAADINNALGGLVFSPDANFNGGDTLSITVDDGSMTVNESLAIQVASVNDAPALTPTNPSVDEGGSVVLTDANFGVTDPDLDALLNTSPQLAKQLVFQLDPGNLPASGTLLLNGGPLLGGSTFSLQDVRDGNLTYVHNGDDVTTGDTDDFSVTINDGGGSGNIGPTPITIALQPVNQVPTIGGSPTVFEGQGSEDEFGNPGTITEAADIGASLSITDRDDTAAVSQITITNVDNAGVGTLFWDANGNGRLDPGEALSGGESFAASELAAGRLRFAHDGDEPGATPNFDIEVTDAGAGTGAGNAESSGPQNIVIAVEPNNDNPDLATNTPITVPSGSALTITTADLEATDADNGAESLVYVVTEVPTLGELRINGEIVGVGARFTQADIDAGLIDYNSTAAVSDGATDSFRFEVRDSTLRAYNDPGVEGADRNPDGSVTEHTFNITLSGDLTVGSAPGDPAPGRSGAVEIASSTNTGVTVTEGDGAFGGSDTVTITTAALEINLQTRDINGDTLAVPPEETVFRITTGPGNGTLLLSGVPLEAFDTFTQADINAGNLTFVHNGSENHQDQFAFSTSGGTDAAFSGTFALNAIPTNDAPVVAANDLPLILEGATIRVGASQIGLSDVDTNNEPGESGGLSDPGNEAVADDLLFRITDLPDNGLLERFDGGGWVAVTTDDLLPATLLTAAADGQTSGLRYTHDGSEIRSDDFTVEVRDDLTSPGTFNILSQSTEGVAAAANLSGTDTVSVTLAALDDAPVSPENRFDGDSTVIDLNGDPQTTANEPLLLAEGDTGVIDGTLLRSVDSDNTDPETLQYRLTDAPEFGILRLGGSQLGVASTFSQADIDNGRISYEHDGSENFADDFSFIVSDSVLDHEYDPGGAQGVSRFDILVTSARNDPPEIDNSGSDVIDLFGTFSHNFGSALNLSDLDIDDGSINGAAGETDFLQVTVALTNSNGGAPDLSSTGGITLGSTAGLTQIDSDDSDGTLVFQGSFTDVQAALTNLTVELQNTDHNDTFSLDVTVDDRLRDSGGGLTSGANGEAGGTTNEDGTPINAVNNTDTVNITFRASDDNDNPTTTGAPGNQVVNEDTVLDLSGYVIDDPDAFDSDLTVVLSVTNGHLSVTGNATTGDPSSLTLTGTVAEINAALNRLTYIANEDFHSSDGLANTDDDVLTVTLNDGGSNGTGGGADVTATPTEIAINPVNDAPTVTVPGTQTLASGSSISFSGATAPTVGDARDAGQTPFTDFQRVTVTIPAGAGTLTASGGAGLVDLDGSGEVLVLEGTLADLNSELDGLTFTPANANVDLSVPITVEIDDLANGGTTLADGIGGALTASDSFIVQVSGVNDGPAVNALANQTVNEDDSLTFSTGNGTAFTISDPDDFGSVMVATVSVDYGVLTAAGGSGAAVAGDGTGALTITGTEDQINAALEGLVYTPDADFHTFGVAGDTITVTIDDQGNTGVGGALTDSQTAEITIAPVNDRPIASGGPETVTVPGEDQTGNAQTLLSLLSGNYDDSTDDQTSDGGDTSSPLSFVAIVGSTDYDPAQGVWQVSDGGGGWIDVPTSGLGTSSALVVEASRDIRFVPAPDFHGTPGTLDVRLADGDTSAAIVASSSAADLSDLASNGGTDPTGRWSAGTVSIDTSVSNENDPPQAADVTLAAIPEDTANPPGDTVANLFGPVFDDTTDDQSGIPGGADASTALGGVAVLGSAADPVSEGVWQYSINGGTSWTDIPQGADDDTNAILLPTSALLRFVPVAEFNGAPGALGVRLSDAPQTFNGSADISAVVGDDPARDTDIWSLPVDLETAVTAQNDAPVLGGSAASATLVESSNPNEGTAPLQLVTGASVSDVDIGTTAGVGTFGAGSITVSVNGGGQSFDQLSVTNPALAGIANVSGGSNGSDLVIDLNTTATPAQVEAILEALRYQSTSDSFSGTRDITITLSDGNNDNGGADAGGPTALTDTLVASITITEQNDPPAGADNTVVTNEDTAFTFTPADFNYSQPGGETDAMDGVQIVSLPDRGTLELNGVPISAGDIISQADIVAGNLTYVPPADQNGISFTDFDFLVRDDRGAFDDAPNTMTVDVLPINDPPVGVNDAITVIEDTPVTQNVLTNDTDAENDSLTISAAEIDTDGDGIPEPVALDVPTALTDASGDPIGTITVSPNGTVTFVPAPNYAGPVPVLGYTPNDGTVDGSPATVTFGPVIQVDDPLTITGLVDGTEPGTDGSVFESGLADGTDAASTTETLTDSFFVTVDDGVTSLGINGTVLSEAALIAATPGAPVNVVTALGTLAITGFDDVTGEVSYSYTLADDTDHSAGPVADDFSLVLTDGDGDTALGTLSIAVIDDAPQANADIDQAINTPGNPSSVAIGNVITGTAPGDPNTLDGVADALGADDLTPPLTGVAAGTGSPSAGNVGVPVAGGFGTLILNDDGSYSYTPDFVNPVVAALTPGASLTDVFTYEISDSDGDTATTTLSISVFGTPAILGLGDGMIAGTDGSVLESDLADGTNAAGNGEALNGSFTLAAPEGIDTISVGGTLITEAALINSATAPVSIVTPLGTLEINGFDLATDTVSYTYTLTDDVDHSGGAVSDSIALTLTDDLGDSGSADLRIAIINDAPVAVADTATVNENDTAPVTGNVVTGSDTIGADETATPVTGVVAGTGAPVGGVGSPVVGSYGALTLNDDGTYSYVLDTSNPSVQALQSGETLTEVFSYEITDSDGDRATATLTLTVTGANDPPVANPDTAETSEGVPVSGNVLVNDTDIDGDPLTVTAATVDVDGDGIPDTVTIGAPTAITDVSGAPVGTVVINTDGSYSFTPASGFSGTVPPVTYTVDDGNGGTSTAELTIEVTPVEPSIIGRDTSLERFERIEYNREPIIVDHIVDETANAAGDLFGTPDLLSDVNTALGVKHPILTAINALQSLEGTPELGTANGDVFSGLRADGPIGETVRSVGFEPQYDQYRLFNRDFPDGHRMDHTDRLGQPAFGDTLSVPVFAETRQGIAAVFQTAKTDGAFDLVARLGTASDGEIRLAAANIDGAGGAGISISKDGGVALLSGLQAGQDLRLQLQTEQGVTLTFDVRLPDEQSDGPVDAPSVSQTGVGTFTAKAEQLAYAGDIETSKLMQAIKWGKL